MASRSQPKSWSVNIAKDEQSDLWDWSASVQTEEPSEQEYDFIEDLSQDFFCPVTFELLRDPQLTTCCGHLLSQRVVTKLQQEGKPCPMCKDHSFPSVPNKHFKRKVEELKVRCSHERNGCTWEGQLGNLDHHSKSCPKRPWQCQYCDFSGTYNIGTTDHLPNCTKYPEPCPNQCDIGTQVPRCDMEKHLTECPLQLVECEFAQAGCRERIPRQDLSRHMEEGAQRHLLSMSLLNLSLTRELHQKMAEKDQQIAELQEQSRKLEEHIKFLQEQGKQTKEQLQTQDGKITDLQQKIQQQITGAQEQLERKVSEQHKEMEKLISGIQAQLPTQIFELFQNESKMLQTALQQQGDKMHEHLLRQGEEIQSSLYRVTGFRPFFDITLTAFGKHKTKGRRGTWESDPFFSHPGGYKFRLSIDTNGCWEAQGTHVTAGLLSQTCEHDYKLSWPIQVMADLQLLNQQGNHGHVATSLSAKINKGGHYIEIARKFIAHSELGYSAAEDTQYLKGDCLHFRLYLKVTQNIKPALLNDTTCHC